jgi:hypothetical protein
MSAYIFLQGSAIFSLAIGGEMLHTLLVVKTISRALLLVNNKIFNKILLPNFYNVTHIGFYISWSKCYNKFLITFLGKDSTRQCEASCKFTCGYSITVATFATLVNPFMVFILWKKQQNGDPLQ